jgi:hypothetical protein
MPYSEFTIEQVEAELGVTLRQEAGLFASVTPVAVSPRLRETLAENLDIALSSRTEKARSEMLVAPILIEVRRQLEKRITLFSGVTFDVDPSHGLSGQCDFLISAEPNAMTITVPVVTVVEAKNDNLKLGLAQCAAEMVAAHRFNARRGREEALVYGTVTTGTLWTFLALRGSVILADPNEHSLESLETILGILCHMARLEN